MDVPTVFIVDPSKQARDFVCGVADDMGLPCEQYASGENFLAALNQQQEGCIVAEFKLSGVGGIELQKALATNYSSLPIVFVTRFANTRQTVRAMSHGALTVLDKPVSQKNLRNALRKAIAQSKEIRGLAAPHRKPCEHFAQLSRQERSVLPFVLASMSNKEIANQLDISKRIVKVTRRKIFKKTQTDSVAELLQRPREFNVDAESPDKVPSSFGRDVSKQLQDTLQQQRELLAHAFQTSIPELVGEVVHELSQPLSVIANSSAIIESAVRQEQTLEINKIREWNAMISDASRLATGIIGRFHAFVAKRQIDRHDEPLEDLVRESIKMLRLSAERHEASIRIAAEQVAASVDRVQIQQVLINLLKNAIESVSRNEQNDRTVQVQIYAEHHSAKIVVSDNGPGVREFEESSIFEPFLSSKDAGLGLGLAISKSIVESHDGRIWYEPNQPQGASFHISLPLSK